MSARLIVRRQIRKKGRPLPELPRLTEEAPDTYNLVYDYVSNEKIGVLKNEAYGQQKRIFQERENKELEKEEKMDNGENFAAEEYVKPTPL